MGQFAGGTGVSAFKQNKITSTFERMDKMPFTDSAMVYMKKGIDKEAAQFKASVDRKINSSICLRWKLQIEDNLFYSSIKLMPHLSLKASRDLPQKYTEQSPLN
jgi:hypothetical protein